MKKRILSSNECCDVLVIGSGLAGINAAVNAAEHGSKVILLTKGELFSGSSFYSGTWGLGVIGPENDSDIADLENSIRTTGCGMTNDDLVHTFVSSIPAALDTLRKRGVRFLQAEHKDQKEFIPCFDHKHRNWNGLEFDSFREVFSELIRHLDIRIMKNCEVLKLEKEGNRISGAVYFNGVDIRFLSASAVILASGGYGSLFQYHLCPDDVIGSGQALALNTGCRLVNMEYMQMMPGLITPAPNIVFNEKTFRFVHIKRSDRAPFLLENLQELLDIRSGHGPFTSRLPSKSVDIEIFRDFVCNPCGVEIQYRDSLKEHPPEFITTYFDWLQRSRGLTPDEPIHVGIFAHAANGGIMIGQDTSTGVEGLFAAGEVTGGMHGADRIGGLSTANGLVFGQIAGVTAAKYAAETKAHPNNSTEFEMSSCTNEKSLVFRLQNTMFKNAMILRDEESLTSALHEIHRIQSDIRSRELPSDSDAAAFYRITLRLLTAESILRAALARKESRGSHYRSDYPTQSDRYDSCFLISKAENICVSPERREAL